ncbi:MAG: hypothetical protein QF357_06410 [Dehalococcoidia bacterium]|nr:hypothetical protein [Dehalococcoidia bacterium]
MPDVRNIGWKNRFLLGVASVTTMFALAACGGGSETADGTVAGDVDSSVAIGSRVVELDRVFTFADFETAGVKHGKDYKIEGLPGAIGAVLGFHDSKDVELRFFPTHEIAVSQGVPVANEIVGSDVFIKLENVTWGWAVADERACAARVPGGGRDCTRTPKYGDFIVYGNVIMFCEARNASEAQARCQAIIDGLPEA